MIDKIKPITIIEDDGEKKYLSLINNEYSYNRLYDKNLPGQAKSIIKFYSLFAQSTKESIDNYLLEKLLDLCLLSECESPIEEMLYIELKQHEAVIASALQSSGCHIYPQFTIRGKNEEVVARVDFAIIGFESKTKYAVECDGFAFHSSKSQLNYDRKRERAVTLMGWEVVRFTGSEIFENPYLCYTQLVDIIGEKENKMRGMP